MNDTPIISFKQLHEHAILPRYATKGSSGMDLCSVVEKIIPPRSRSLVSTGWAIALASGYEAQVRPRSGLAISKGLTVLNAPGTIDQDYRGEVKLILYNSSIEPIHIHVGDRVAQMVIAPVICAEGLMSIVEELPDTDRGTEGFGHSGLR